MSEAFGVVLDQVLGPHGLVVYDAADPNAKPLARGTVRPRDRRPGPRRRRWPPPPAPRSRPRATTRRSAPRDQAAPLFLIDGTRRAIRFRGDVAVVGDRRTAAGRPRRRWPRTAPERFSPNVLLRPLVQDTIFPTVCYVGGPSELAYLGQLRDVYAHFGVPMPLVVPRASASVVDSATLRFLAKHDIPFHQFQRQDELTLNQLLESQLPQAVEVSFADAGRRGARQRLEARYRRGAHRRPDARRRREGDAGQDAARAADAARQGRPRRQEEGRDAAPAVHAHADASSSRTASRRSASSASCGC